MNKTAVTSEAVKARPEGLEPIWKHPKTGREYFVVKTRLKGPKMGVLMLISAQNIEDWRYVLKSMPDGYYIDFPRRGKPMIKRIKHR